MYRRALCIAGLAIALPALLLANSGHDPVKANAAKCEPEIVVQQVPGLAPNSTYISNSEPPARFLQMPKGHIKIVFGREMIDKHCGVPPCGRRFLGCVRNDLMVLPDPSAPDFAKIARHEIGHWNGWPATHGD